MADPRLHIAMIGTRGLPATFGGVEHHVEEIGRRLAARGHRVTVYSEKGYGADQVIDHLGMEIVPVPAVHNRSLEALTHSALSTVAAMRQRPDVLHYHAVGPGYMTPVPRALSRAAIVQTVHGLDAYRAKWGKGARRFLETATWLSARVPHRTVTVSPALREHYAWRYNRSALAIPNGITAPVSRPASIITEKYGLQGQDYILFVGRLVPEKRPELLIQAFEKLETDQRLVVVGGSSFTDDYVSELQRLAARDPRVTLTGFVYGEELDELFTNATAFVQCSDLEGLPLTLLEAIGTGLPVVVSDIPPHLGVVTDDRPGGRVFHAGDVDDLRQVLEHVVGHLDEERIGAALLSQEALRDYDWDTCTDRLEEVYRDAMDRASGSERRDRPYGSQ